MANQDAAFGLRPIGRIGGTPLLVDKTDTESPQTTVHLSSKVTW